MSKVTNVIVGLGPRMLMVGKEALGTSDNISIDKRLETGKQREPFYLPYLGRMHLARIREIEESQYRMIELK